MVSTESIERRTNSHTQRDIIGIFTLTATAMKQPTSVDLDDLVLKHAHQVIAVTRASYIRGKS